MSNAASSGQRPAVDAADPARGEDADPRRVGRDHRRRDRRRRPAAGVERRRQARPSGLQDRARRSRRQGLERRRVEPDEDPPVADATVAGTAPASRTAASDASATSRFWGYGRPWLISVDSSATTGRPALQRAGHLRVDIEPVGDHPRASSGEPRRELPRPAARWPAERGAVERGRDGRQRVGRRGEEHREKSRVEGVAGAGRVGRSRAAASPPRIGAVPARPRASTRRAAGTALDDRERRRLEQPADIVAAEVRLGLGRGREQDVRRRIVDEAPGGPPALREERRRRREVEADERARARAPARSPADRRRRAATR